MTEKKLTVPSTVDRGIFRAYDIRGIVGQGLDESVMYALGLAIGTEAQAGKKNTVALGRDARLTSPTLAEAMAAGLMAAGCDVIDIGVVATPVLYFALPHLSLDHGVMVTASHNPSEYNGVKIVLNGNTLNEGGIAELYQRIMTRNFSAGDGQLKKLSIVEAYIDRIVGDIQLARPLKVVVDCGNSVAGFIAPTLYRKLGAEVVTLYCDVDGRFPNHHPDPTIEENLQDLIQAVKVEQADLGIALDGDADRLGVIANDGSIIWPDRQMMLFSQDVLARHPGETILFDVKCSRLLGEHIKKHGGKPLMWKTGHSLLKAKMKQEQALLAGEMSGHIFFKERWYGFDDGLYAGARLLEIIAKQTQTVQQRFASFPSSVSTPELKVPCREAIKFSVVEQFIAEAIFPEAALINIDGLRVEFASGWGLLRASNTSPNLILRFEAESKGALQQIIRGFREQLLRVETSLNMDAVDSWLND